MNGLAIKRLQKAVKKLEKKCCCLSKQPNQTSPPGPFADDAAAKAGGVEVGELYYTDSGEVKVVVPVVYNLLFDVGRGGFPANGDVRTNDGPPPIITFATVDKDGNDIASILNEIQVGSTLTYDGQVATVTGIQGIGGSFAIFDVDAIWPSPGEGEQFLDRTVTIQI